MQALACVYFEGGAGAAISGEPADPRRGAADGGQLRQAAGTAAVDAPHMRWLLEAVSGALNVRRH